MHNARQLAMVCKYLVVQLYGTPGTTAILDPHHRISSNSNLSRLHCIG